MVQRRFRLSIRTLMIAVALCALFLAPVAWMFRRMQVLVSKERLAAEAARNQAERALYVAQVSSAQAAPNTARLGNTNLRKAGSLWAALSVNHPIFKAGQTKELRIEFTLVNDGDQVIDPKILESRIVINGKELADSGLIVSNGLNNADVTTLSPGQNLQFGLPLGDQFNEPGTYRVSWKGTGFESPEIMVRILPEKAR